MAIRMPISSYIAKIQKSSWMPLGLNFFTFFDIVISKVLSISINKKGVGKSSLILWAGDSFTVHGFLNGGISNSNVIHFSLGLPEAYFKFLNT